MDRKKVKNLILESADNILDEATVEKLVLLNEEFIEQRVDEKTQEYKEKIDLLESTIEENQEKYEAELQEAVNTLIEKELEQEDSEDDEDESDDEEDSEAEEELKEAVNRIIELEILLIEKEEQEDDGDAEDDEDESDDEDDEEDEEQEDDDEKEELKEQVQILTAELEYVKKMGILVEMLNNDVTLSDNQKDLVISNATKLEMETLTQFEDEVREIMKQIKTKGKLYESKQNKYSYDDEEVLITESTKKVVKVAPLMKESKASIEPTFIDYSGLL